MLPVPSAQLTFHINAAAAEGQAERSGNRLAEGGCRRERCEQEIVLDAVAQQILFVTGTAHDGIVDQAAFTIDRIGDRPAGRLEAAVNGPTLYDDLLAVDRHLGIRTEPRIASTDANIPLSLGIAAISIGAGGDGGGIHTRNEWYDATQRELALKRILLLLMLTAARC